MFHVKVSFYGRGNAPRGLKGCDSILVAEAHAFYVMDRYENRELVGKVADKRIKKVEVINQETGVTELAWFYPRDYNREQFLHGLPKNNVFKKEHVDV